MQIFSIFNKGKDAVSSIAKKAVRKVENPIQDSTKIASKLSSDVFEKTQDTSKVLKEISGYEDYMAALKEEKAIDEKIQQITAKYMKMFEDYNAQSLSANGDFDSNQEDEILIKMLQEKEPLISAKKALSDLRISFLQRAKSNPQLYGKELTKIRLDADFTAYEVPEVLKSLY